MKKSRRLLICLLAFFVLPLSIFSVSSSWTYYDGCDPVSSELKITLGRFDFTVPNEDKPEFDKGFDDTHSGHENRDVVETIVNHAVKEKDDPTSFASLHNIIHDDNHRPNSGYYTTVDINNKEYGKAHYTGEQIKEALNLDGYVNFAMQRVGSTLLEETWYVYTTDFNFNSIQEVSYTDDDGSIHTEFNHKYVYDVYRSQLAFTTDFEDGGTYELVGAVKGYCEASINLDNNPNSIFFNPNTFIEGAYVPLNSISINGPSKINSTSTPIKFDPIFTPSEATERSIHWKSSDPLVATIDHNGVLTPMKDGEVTITLSSTLLNVEPAILKVTIDSGQVIMPQTIKINGPTNVVMGKTVKFNAIMTPNNVTNKNAIWTTSDESIATFDEYGNLYVKEGKSPTRVTIYAQSELDPTIKTSQELIVQLPAAGNADYNGRYKVDQVTKELEYFNAKDVDLDSSTYLYPAGTTNQAIKVVIPKSSNQKRVEVTYSSDKMVFISSMFLVNQEGKLESYSSSNGIILNSSPLMDLTYYITFGGSAPILVNVNSK